jgi:hypothetical protein
MRSRKAAPSDGLKYQDERLVASVRNERARVTTALGHMICGRYLGNRDGHPNVCWESPRHGGSHT